MLWPNYKGFSILVRIPIVYLTYLRGFPSLCEVFTDPFLRNIPVYVISVEYYTGTSWKPHNKHFYFFGKHHFYTNTIADIDVVLIFFHDITRNSIFLELLNIENLLQIFKKKNAEHYIHIMNIFIYSIFMKNYVIIFSSRRGGMWYCILLPHIWWPFIHWSVPNSSSLYCKYMYIVLSLAHSLLREPLASPGRFSLCRSIQERGFLHNKTLCDLIVLFNNRCDNEKYKDHFVTGDMTFLRDFPYNLKWPMGWPIMRIHYPF